MFNSRFYTREGILEGVRSWGCREMVVKIWQLTEVDEGRFTEEIVGSGI